MNKEVLLTSGNFEEEKDSEEKTIVWSLTLRKVLEVSVS